MILTTPVALFALFALAMGAVLVRHAVRIWRGQASSTPGVRILAAPDFARSLLMGGVSSCFLGAMIGAVGHLRATGVIGGANPPPPSPAVAVVLLFLLLGVVISSSALTAIICFNRPRFLIPPHLRDWPGVMSTRRRRPTEPQEAERDAVDDHPRITPATTPQQDRPDTVPIPHQRPTVRQEAGRDVMSEQASAPGSVRVSRDATSPRDRLRAYTILVDDAAVAKVRPGKSVSVGLSPGPHTVRVKIDWCRSPELVVTVAAGAEHRLECGPRVAGGGDMSMVTTERDTYLWLRPSDESAG